MTYDTWKYKTDDGYIYVSETPSGWQNTGTLRKGDVDEGVVTRALWQAQDDGHRPAEALLTSWLNEISPLVYEVVDSDYLIPYYPKRALIVLCHRLGLADTGTKADLVARLLDDAPPETPASDTLAQLRAEMQALKDTRDAAQARLDALHAALAALTQEMT